MIGIKVDGLDSILAEMKGLPQQLQKGALDSACRQAANVCKSDARRRVVIAAKSYLLYSKKSEPKQFANPGWLKKQIRTVKRKTPKNLSKFSVIVSERNRKPDRAFFFRYLENGTKFIKARPFIRPSLDENQEQIHQAFAKEIALGLAKGRVYLKWKAGR